MKNQDKPAYPVSEHIIAVDNSGLTKLEYFSAMAMQGFLSNLPLDKLRLTDDKALELTINIGKSSIVFAKELLNQLENEQD